MSYFDDASLVMIPSGYKDQKVYSVKPIDGSGDLTFSRASNATRVNSSGLVEKVRENLLLQSNSFDTTWTNTRSTESSGYAGYDGTNDAWKLEEDSNTGTHKIQQSTTTTGVVSASVYAKAAERSALQFLIESGGSYVGANFNLNDGSVQSSFGATFTLIEATSTSVGSGWYRVKFAANVTSSAAFTIYTLDSGFNTSYTGTTGEGIYIQDAQLNYGLVAQTYQETTTAAVVSGITNDMPRLNYDPANPTCPSLLLEPSRTNIITNSEYFGASSWVKSGNGTGSVPVITSNNAISPEGVQNATRVDLDLNGGTGSGDWSWVYQNFTATGNDETFSIYVKAVDASNVGKIISFGAVSFDNYTLTEDWVRIVSTSSGSVGGYGNGFRLRGTEATSDTASFYVYGAQHEQNASYASSLIPTYGSSATRTADIASKTGISSLIGQTEGTVFVDLVYNGSEAQTGNVFSFDQSTSGSVVIVRNSNGSIGSAVWDGSAKAAINGGSMPIGQRTKIAYAYKSGSTALFVNGVQIGSDNTDTFTLPTISQIYLNSLTAYFAFQQDASFNQALLFKTRLSNADLATLTA